MLSWYGEKLTIVRNKTGAGSCSPAPLLVKNIKSFALPLLYTGIFGYPKDEARPITD